MEGTKLKKMLGLRWVYSTGYSIADGRWEGISGSGTDDNVRREASCRPSLRASGGGEIWGRLVEEAEINGKKRLILHFECFGRRVEVEKLENGGVNSIVWHLKC